MPSYLITNKVNLPVMKQNLRFALLGAVIGLTGSVLGMQALSATPFGVAGTSTTMESGYMLGHITLTVADANGNIKSYIQTDNRVLDQGEACAVKRTFSTAATGSGDCGGTATNAFDVIALGTSSTAEADNDIALGAETSASGLVRAAASSATVTDDSDGSQGAKIALVKAFTNTSAGTVNIAESGIFNSTSVDADGIFARKVFTAIPVAVNDALTVTWTITFDGA